jgi:hypothetical protein
MDFSSSKYFWLNNNFTSHSHTSKNQLFALNFKDTMHCVPTKFTKFVCIITFGNHNTLINNIVFTANIVAPVFLIVALGYLAKRLSIINVNFVEVTSKLVFNVSLPVFIFLEIIHLELSNALEAGQIV